jgi:hypothetical protein
VVEGTKTMSSLPTYPGKLDSGKRPLEDAREDLRDTSPPVGYFRGTVLVHDVFLRLFELVWYVVG